MPLTSDQRAIIKSTVPVLAARGTEITTHFYNNLFDNYPTLRSLFSYSSSPAGNSRQPAALAASLFAYASHIDDLTPILPVVEKICQKHASLNISAGQYAIVGEGVLNSLREVLGADVFTDEVRDAWAAAYNELAAIMSGREEDIMSSQTKTAGGWRGWRRMRCVKRVRESEEVVSFYWTPTDEGRLPPYKSGQYISLRIDVPGLGIKQIRQYSLSDAPESTTQEPLAQKNELSNGYVYTNGHANPVNGTCPISKANGIHHHHHQSNIYRITVKRDAGVANATGVPDDSALSHPGYVSNLLHDTIHEGDVVEMSHPAGEFFLDATADLTARTPIVLISAGVGLTPLMSILQTLLQKQDEGLQRPISWIHVARNKSVDPFADDIARTAREHANVQSRVYHSAPGETEEQGADYDVRGRLDVGRLSKDERRDLLHVHDETARYFVCGPDAFMGSVAGALHQMGVEEARVKMELFGTGSVGAVAS